MPSSTKQPVVAVSDQGTAATAHPANWAGPVGAPGNSAAVDVVAPTSARRERPIPRWWRILGGALLPILILVVWWAFTEFTDVPPYKLPSPADVAAAAVDLAGTGLIWTHILISTQRVLTGFVIGSAVGLVLGSLVGLSRSASIILGPTISALRAVPSLAWAPLLLLYLGIFEVPKVTLIAIGAAFPVFTTLSIALRHVDPHLVEVGRAFGFRGVPLLTTVQLPAVVPSIVSGLRLALAQSWLFLVAAELLNSSMGIGFLLLDSGQNGRVDRMFLAIILFAVLGKVMDSLIGLFERWLNKRWG